jgi:hypothetical protein
MGLGAVKAAPNRKEVAEREGRKEDTFSFI